MPDYSKCPGNDCKEKHLCMRYISEPGVNQSYDDFTSLEKNEGKCVYIKPIYLKRDNKKYRFGK